ncbi:MAG TPA: hypothetical protein VEF35_03920, partial [Candidatus Bathyarchaeia archaeon]|nr:hypothetical protein [Candidatus Bathyarchaeia archaeon]
WDDLAFSAQTIDENLERICRGLCRPTLILATSDHPIHVEKWAHLEDNNTDVPLIASYVNVASGPKKGE